MTVDQLLAEFGAGIGLPALALDNAGRCRLTFDRTVHVDMEYDGDADRLQVYTVLGPVPAEGREALFRRMLAGNLFGTETGTACFALDDLNDDILLFTTIEPAAADAARLQDAVANLLARAEAWQAAQGAPNAAADAAAPTATPTFMIRG